MLKKLGIGTALISLVFIFTACISPEATPQFPETAATIDIESPPESYKEPEIKPSPKPPGPIEGTWIEPAVDSEKQLVLLPLDEIEEKWNIHFKVETDKDDITFMSYIYEDQLHVRANVCPPCLSIGYALDEANGLLICDMCATLFDAGTGSGIKGACVDYPKAEVPYEIEDGNILLKGQNLLSAYQETLSPG